MATTSPYGGIFEGYIGDRPVYRAEAVSGPKAGDFGGAGMATPSFVTPTPVAAPAAPTAGAVASSPAAGQVGSSINYGQLISAATKGIGDSLALGIMAGAKNTPTITSPDGYAPALANYQFTALPSARPIRA